MMYRCVCVCAGTSDPPLLRLQLVGGGGPNAGRLEVDLGGGEWGTVCGGGERFSYLSAYVVCRQLNYATAVRPGVFLNRYMHVTVSQSGFSAGIT